MSSTPTSSTSIPPVSKGKDREIAKGESHFLTSRTTYESSIEGGKTASALKEDRIELQGNLWGTPPPADETTEEDVSPEVLSWGRRSPAAKTYANEHLLLEIKFLRKTIRDLQQTADVIDYRNTQLVNQMKIDTDASLRRLTWLGYGVERQGFAIERLFSQARMLEDLALQVSNSLHLLHGPCLMSAGYSSRTRHPRSMDDGTSTTGGFASPKPSW